jgi:nucleoside-diphosphate-sugar epimerase
MKFLITGGSGFIGTNLVEYYSSKGHEVLNIDRVKPKIENHNQYWKKLDIRNTQEVMGIVSEFNPEYVIHMAADTGLTGTSLDNYDTNLEGVKNVLKLCKEISSIKKIIFASTMLVCKAGHIPRSDSDYSATTLYGKSKAIAEDMVRKSALKCDWVIVRPSSIWGPWFGRTYREFFELILAKKYMNFGGKMSTKTYGFISNVIYQIDRILFDERSNGKTLYLGDYEPTNIKVWSQEISFILNQKVKVVPKFLVIIAALVGDVLGKFNFRFPLNSFRIANMTTDNILDLSKTKEIAPNLPYSRIEGSKFTIDWIESQKK